MSNKEYIGHRDQLFGVKNYRIDGGKGDGSRVVELDNGAGLQLTVLPDRALDLYQIKFKGHNCGYIAPNGIMSPALCDGNQFLDYFFVGFLTTCGLNNIGSPGEDDGEQLGLHGWINATPAEGFSLRVVDGENGPEALLEGNMVKAAIFGGNVSFRREIRFAYGDNRIYIKDTAINNGYRKEPFMLLYHFNMGYPLLSEDSELRIPSAEITPRTEHAEKNLEQWKNVTPPAAPYEEMCYFHDIREDEKGRAYVGITNHKLGIGFTMKYNKADLPHFTQWKMLGKGEYAMGLEPCNASIDGRANARKDGTLKFLEPGQSKEINIELKFF